MSIQPDRDSIRELASGIKALATNTTQGDACRELVDEMCAENPKINCAKLKRFIDCRP